MDIRRKPSMHKFRATPLVSVFLLCNDRKHNRGTIKTNDSARQLRGARSTRGRRAAGCVSSECDSSAAPAWPVVLTMPRCATANKGAACTNVVRSPVVDRFGEWLLQGDYPRYTQVLICVASGARVEELDGHLIWRRALVVHFDRELVPVTLGLAMSHHAQIRLKSSLTAGFGV